MLPRDPEDRPIAAVPGEVVAAHLRKAKLGATVAAEEKRIGAPQLLPTN